MMPFPPRRSIAAAHVVALVALAGGCAPPDRPGDVVVYASGADLESGNPLVTTHPLARQLQRFALFVTLVRLDSMMAIEPYFARRWDWADDHRRLTMHLHRGLTWHDGLPTTAVDVRFTLETARDPVTGYARHAELAALDDIRVVDDSTLELRFDRPQRDLPALFAELPIVPAHLLGGVPREAMRQAPFNLAPVGNGPFRFLSRDPGQRWVFERNEGFPDALGGPPRLRRLIVAVVDEPTTKFAGLVSGDLDVAGIAPTMAQLTADDPLLRVVSYPVLFVSALVLNTEGPPFDDLRVRQAVSAAIDRQRIIDAALAGFAVSAAGPVSPDHPLALDVGVREDGALADSLLDAAGWLRGADGLRRRGGVPLEFELLTVGSGTNAVEQLIQDDLAARGVRVAIRALELGAFLTAARAQPRRFDALITLIPGDLALSFLPAMFDSRQRGGALDYSGYLSAELDALFTRARESGERTEERQAWREVQRHLGREMPVVWLYHARGVQGVARRLRGVAMDLRGELPTVADWHTVDEAAPASAASR